MIIIIKKKIFSLIITHFILINLLINIVLLIFGETLSYSINIFVYKNFFFLFG